MRIIKTKQDIVILRRAGTLPVALLVHVENYYKLRSVELDDEEESKFRFGPERLHRRSRSRRQRP